MRTIFLYLAIVFRHVEKLPSKIILLTFSTLIGQYFTKQCHV